MKPEAAEDDLALRVLALFDEGISSEADQAEALGITLAEVRKIRKRLRDAGERIKRKEKRS